MHAQGRQARERGSPFALLNGAVARDVACLLLREGVELQGPVHVLYLSTCALLPPGGSVLMKREHAVS